MKSSIQTGREPKSVWEIFVFLGKSIEPLCYTKKVF